MILPVREEMLQKAVSIDSNQDYVGDQNFIEDVYSAFEQEWNEFGEADYEYDYDEDEWSWQDKRYSVATRHREASRIIGTEIMDNRDEELGEIEDLIVEATTGHLAYAIVDAEDLLEDLDLDSEQVAIPWMGLDVRGENYVLTQDRHALRDLTYDFDARGVRGLESARFARRAHRVVDVRPFWHDVQQQQRTEMGRRMEMRDRQQRYDRGWRSDREMARRGDRYWREEDRGRGMDTRYGEDRSRYADRGRYGDRADRRGRQSDMDWYRPVRGEVPEGERVTIQGKVQNVWTHTAGRLNELVLQVQTQDGETIMVQAGPDWFARQENVEFKKGDQITITGRRIDRQDQGKVVVAGSVRAGGQTLQLRDDQMRPEWVTRR